MSEIDERIAQAVRDDRLYIPTWREWQRATPSQRKNMSWPRNVIEQIVRERP